MWERTGDLKFRFSCDKYGFSGGTAELEAFRDSLIEKAVELMGLNHH